MRHTFFILIFTVLVTAFYNYVGQMVPQKETYPPKNTEIRADMTVDEMVEAGSEIAGGKGACLGCHTIGSDKSERFPDLGGIGAKAATRKQGLNDVEYLAESMYEPGAFIVKGFNPGMPVINKPPINLSDQEILAVIAYLQSLGGTPTVTMKTKLKYAGAAPPPSTASIPAGGSAEDDNLEGDALLAKYGCAACHSLTAPGRLVGPSLFDVGNRLDIGQLYEAIMDSDATIAEGFPPGLMGATLTGMGFYDKVTTKQLKTMVDYLSSRKGEG